MAVRDTLSAHDRALLDALKTEFALNSDEDVIAVVEAFVRYCGDGSMTPADAKRRLDEIIRARKRRERRWAIMKFRLRRG